tara:strand:+ start:512 stop:784 length:273 start_codon:yes stop_codon:yes gene_type:complete
MKTFEIENEDHTVGCLLRPRLFNEGASFAACVVKHPKDTFISIQIEADDEIDCLLSAITNAHNDLDKMIKYVDAHKIHMNMEENSMEVSS